VRTKIVYGPGGRKLFYIDGKEVTAEEYAETIHPWKIKDLLGKMKAPGGTQASGWPKTSVALACHPDQVAEMNARNKQHGIGTRYDASGTAHVPDAADFRKIQKLERLHDNDSFY
jgi:hypothetical protein